MKKNGLAKKYGLRLDSYTKKKLRFKISERLHRGPNLMKLRHWNWPFYI